MLECAHDWDIMVCLEGKGSPDRSWREQACSYEAWDTKGCREDKEAWRDVGLAAYMVISAHSATLLRETHHTPPTSSRSSNRLIFQDALMSWGKSKSAFSAPRPALPPPMMTTVLLPLVSRKGSGFETWGSTKSREAKSQTICATFTMTHSEFTH